MVILNTKRISDYVLTIKEDEINVESNVIEQRDKADYEMIKTTRFELVSVHKELNVTIASRDNEKP